MAVDQFRDSGLFVRSDAGVALCYKTVEGIVGCVSLLASANKDHYTIIASLLRISYSKKN